jgi:hypothetical protein
MKSVTVRRNEKFRLPPKPFTFDPILYPMNESRMNETIFELIVSFFAIFDVMASCIGGANVAESILLRKIAGSVRKQIRKTL